MLKSVCKRSVVCLLILLVASVLLLSGCESAIINNGLHRNECELYVNALLKGDFEAAHAVTPALSEEEHRPYFNEFCKSFRGATSYTLTQTGWNINTTNGVTTRTAAYQIELDTGVICQLTLQTHEDVEGIAYINFNDSSAFIESTKNVGTVNILLIVGSLVLMVFPVWMLIDCIKRKMAKKAWWIVLILLSLSLTFTNGAHTMNTSFMVSLFCFFSSIEAVIPNETVSLTVVLPIGALIYCFLRKKLTAKYEAQLTMEAAPAATPLTAADFLVQESAAPAASDAATDAAPAAEDATAPADKAPADVPAEEAPETSEQP